MSTVTNALRELIRLRDLKADAQAINTSGNQPGLVQQRTMLAEHEAKNDRAWDTARRALNTFDLQLERAQRLPIYERLQLVQERLIAAGVTDVKFTWGDLTNVPPTKIAADMVQALEAMLDGRVKPVMCGAVWDGTVHVVCNLPIGHKGDHGFGHYTWPRATPSKPSPDDCLCLIDSTTPDHMCPLHGEPKTLVVETPSPAAP